MFGIDRPNVGFWLGRGPRNMRDEHSNPWVLGKVEDLALRWTGQAGYARHAEASWRNILVQVTTAQHLDAVPVPPGCRSAVHAGSGLAAGSHRVSGAHRTTARTERRPRPHPPSLARASRESRVDGWPDARDGSPHPSRPSRPLAVVYPALRRVSARPPEYVRPLRHCREWPTASGCRFIQVVCTASKSTLAERYRRRSLSGERHPGHTESEHLEETIAQLFLGNWEALALEGPVISVNTESLPSAALIENIVC